MGQTDMLRAKQVRDVRRKKRKAWPPFSLRGVAVLLLLLILLAIGILPFVNKVQGDQIAEGVRIGPVEIGGKDMQEAERLLDTALIGYRLTFRTADAQATFAVEATDQEHAQPIAVFDKKNALQQAFSYGRESDLWSALKHRLHAVVSGVDVNLPFQFDKDALLKRLQEEFGPASVDPQDAHLKIYLGGGQTSTTVTADRPGIKVFYDEAISTAESRLETISSAPITIKIASIAPSVMAKDAEAVKDGVADAINRAPILVTAKNRSWTISPTQIAAWLDAIPVDGFGQRARLGLDVKKAEKFLTDRSAALRIEPVEGIFEMKDGKVVNFQTSTNGLALDVPSSVAIIENYVFRQPVDNGQELTQPLDLPMAIVRPKVDTATSNPYGITEVIGVGTSNFRGSPTNRRKNIATGAASLNGILILPGEEFSTLRALGPVDGEHGYLEELVIKNNKTTPEFGGGLCQIGTTTFRAALAAGLPVTERRNHSYRVPYYELDGDGTNIGPGKDATIYDPAPDFKFMNDTGNGILIQTAIKGNKLTFTFWGTLDGRKAAQGEVTVWNKKPPPEKKVIETTELKPGETKCTEKAHEGSDVTFTYTITYADGRELKKEFFSRYKPWGEVCLLGVDPNTPKATTTAAVPSADAQGAAGN